MKYCKTDDLNVLLSENDVRQALINVSLPAELTDEALRPLGYACVPAEPLPDDMVMDEANIPDFRAVYDATTDSYRRETFMRTLPPEQAQARLERKSAEVRAIRNDLLGKSDWVIVRSTEKGTDARAWKTYREALRDLTEQPGFPYNVTFPTPPASTEEDV